MEDLTKLTKEQLAARLAQLEEALADKDTQLQEKSALVDDLSEQVKVLNKRGEGWLISCSNPLYNGVTYGIQFINGQAFILANQVVEAFVVPETKAETLRKQGLKEEEVQAALERAKIPTSTKAAHALRDNFGYDIQYFTGHDKKQLDQVIDRRLQEATQARIALKQQELLENSVKPNFLGG